MLKINVKEEIGKVLKGLGGRDEGRDPDNRYASFDYCYNYFRSFKNKPKQLVSKNNMQMSCLQLGFYLSSWGMMRGSSFLLMKSVRHYEGLIGAISEMDGCLWDIDVPTYNDENIKMLMDCKNKIKEVLEKEKYKSSDTLITKIMLGIFANVPAYDTYFKKFLKRIGASQTFNEKSLKVIKEFYDGKKKDFNVKIRTYDFWSGKETGALYTKAKLVDMCGFANGYPK